MNNERSIDEIITDIKRRDKKQNTLLVSVFVVIVVSSIGAMSSLVFYLSNKIEIQENDLEKIKIEYMQLASKIEIESKELSNINQLKIENIDNELSQLDEKTKKQVNLLWKSAYKKNKEVIDSIAVEVKSDNAKHLKKINSLIESRDAHNTETEGIIKKLKSDLNILSESLNDLDKISKTNADILISLEGGFTAHVDNYVTVKSDIDIMRSRTNGINTSINELKSRIDEISNKLIQPTKKSGG